MNPDDFERELDIKPIQISIIHKAPLKFSKNSSYT